MGRSKDVEARVVAVLRDRLGIPEERIAPHLFIMGEVDSPDQVKLIMELEEAFDIAIPDDEATEIRTVADAIRCVEGRIGRAEAAGVPKPWSGGAGLLWDRELDG